MEIRRFWLAVLAVIGLTLPVSAQTPNWQNMDLKADGFFGISTEKAYTELLKGKKPVTVTVAIMDSGIDTLHEDLEGVVWRNPNEVTANNRDDDRNGYVDDLHGWNFIGSEIGKEDITELVLAHKTFYDSLAYDGVPPGYREGYKAYQKLWNDYNGHLNNAQVVLNRLIEFKDELDSLLRKMEKNNPSPEDFKNYKPAATVELNLSAYDAVIPSEKNVIASVLGRLKYYKSFKDYRKYEIDDLIAVFQFHITHGLSLKKTEGDLTVASAAVGHLGNGNIQNDAAGPVGILNLSFMHGTHVSGIIAAKRNNGVGINGIADHAQIMMLKVLSSIRELRDHDLAAAIRYAADKGAKVINLSFGKPYTLHKKEIDDAVKYAMQHDVLIVLAAGNTGTDLDQTEQFPTRFYGDHSGSAAAWIEVGASGMKDDSTLAAPFSNYGVKTVDVFAPGVQIDSTIPGNGYSFQDGTSMAAPVVSGLAALIREYYPELTAVQVKDIIMRSVEKREVLKNKCVSGGVVNAYNALKLAATYQSQQ
jgi:subtilisin family serine protease